MDERVQRMEIEMAKVRAEAEALKQALAVAARETEEKVQRVVNTAEQKCGKEIARMLLDAVTTGPDAMHRDATSGSMGEVEISSKVSAVLAQLTSEKEFEHVLQQVASLELRDAQAVNCLACQLHALAIRNAEKTELYARAAAALDVRNAVGCDDVKERSFRRALLGVCQTMFDAIRCNNEEDRLGNLRFIGHLFNVGLLQPRVVTSILKDLSARTLAAHSSDLEALVVLLDISGSTIDSSLGRHVITPCLSAINSTGGKKASPSLKPQLIDTITHIEQRFQTLPPPLKLPLAASTQHASTRAGKARGKTKKKAAHYGALVARPVFERHNSMSSTSSSGSSEEELNACRESTPLAEDILEQLKRTRDLDEAVAVVDQAVEVAPQLESVEKFAMKAYHEGLQLEEYHRHAVGRLVAACAVTKLLGTKGLLEALASVGREVKSKWGERRPLGKYMAGYAAAAVEVEAVEIKRVCDTVLTSVGYVKGKEIIVLLAEELRERVGQEHAVTILSSKKAGLTFTLLKAGVEWLDCEQRSPEDTDYSPDSRSASDTE
jgi:hypothetical protein